MITLRLAETKIFMNESGELFETDLNEESDYTAELRDQLAKAEDHSRKIRELLRKTINN